MRGQLSPVYPAVDNHLRPGERNPIEGKFGQAKTAYGMNRIRAKLAITSQSWIASIILVLNLVKWTGAAPYYLAFQTFSMGASLFYAYILGISNQMVYSFGLQAKITPSLAKKDRFCEIKHG